MGVTLGTRGKGVDDVLYTSYIRTGTNFSKTDEKIVKSIDIIRYIITFNKWHFKCYQEGKVHDAPQRFLVETENIGQTCRRFGSHLPYSVTAKKTPRDDWTSIENAQF